MQRCPGFRSDCVLHRGHFPRLRPIGPLGGLCGETECRALLGASGEGESITTRETTSGIDSDQVVSLFAREEG